MRRMFDSDETEAVLLIDASNAFNALNRKAALHNIEYTCPEFATFARNLYQCDAELFVPGSEDIVMSREGTTQGGPESMGLYAASTVMLTIPSPGIKKVFYADDGAGAGTLTGLLEWWKDLQVQGPLLGYFPNPGKTWLITKSQFYDQALRLFPDVNVTVEGHAYLGSFIGSQAATEKFVDEQIATWSVDIEALAKIADSDPQLAYSAYIFGTSRRWQFLCRSTPNVSQTLERLEVLLKSKLIPSILGTSFCSEEMRKVLRLPPRLGGMGFQNPSEESDCEYENSRLATNELSNAIFEQQTSLHIDSCTQEAALKEVKACKERRLNEMQEEMKAVVSDHLQKVIQLLCEKGASSWLTSLPLQELGFRLNKLQFNDAICMRYDIRPRDVPSRCACGEQYSINHCLSCKNGGYVHIRHNIIRNTIHDRPSERHLQRAEVGAFSSSSYRRISSSWVQYKCRGKI